MHACALGDRRKQGAFYIIPETITPDLHAVDESAEKTTQISEMGSQQHIARRLTRSTTGVRTEVQHKELPQRYSGIKAKV